MAQNVEESPAAAKASGSADQLRGQVKEGVGEMTGDEKLKRQGRDDQSQGALKKAWGNIKAAFSSSKH